MCAGLSLSCKESVCGSLILGRMLCQLPVAHKVPTASQGLLDHSSPVILSISYPLCCDLCRTQLYQLKAPLMLEKSPSGEIQKCSGSLVPPGSCKRGRWQAECQAQGIFSPCGSSLKSLAIPIIPLFSETRGSNLNHFGNPWDYSKGGFPMYLLKPCHVLRKAAVL